MTDLVLVSLKCDQKLNISDIVIKTTHQTSKNQQDFAELLPKQPGLVQVKV